MAEAHRDEIAKLEALYASNPGGRVFTHLAEAYRKAGEPDRARQILADGMKNHPDSASAYVVLGRVLSDRGDVQEGFDAFQRALELDTGNLVALRWCGDLAMRAGRVDDALGFYHELIARDPSDSNLRERVEIIENDRAAAMSAPPSEPAVQPNAVPESRAPEEAAAVAEFEGAELEISGHDFDPGDLPGDLAVFAGRQIESRTGQSWTPPEPSAAHQAADDASLEDGLLDLPMDTSFGMGESADLQIMEDAHATEAPSMDFGSIDLADDQEVDVFADQASEFDMPEQASFSEEPRQFEAPPSFDEALPVDEAQSIEDALPVEQAPSFEEPMPVEAAQPIEAGGFAEAVGGEPATPSAEADDVSGDVGFAGEPGYAGTETDAELTPTGAIAAPVTETMAELYRNQGFADRAADVYRQLLRERGSDERLEQKLAEIEAELAPSIAAADVGPSEMTETHTQTDELVFEQDAAGEMWLKDAESPWTAEEPGGADHTSPYAMAAEPEEPAAAAPPIASYFQSLLQWRPGTTAAAPTPTNGDAGAHAFESPGDTGGGADGGYDDVLLLDEDTASTSDSGIATTEAERDLPWLSEPAPSSQALSAEQTASGSAPTELMPWETAEPAEPAGPAGPAGPAEPAEPVSTSEPAAMADDAMPWDTPATNVPVAASNEELMPWETSPAASMAAPEAAAYDTGSVPGAGASDFDFAAAASAAEDMRGSDGAQGADGGEGEDDEDLEMFRSWLQSLKK